MKMMNIGGRTTLNITKCLCVVYTGTCIDQRMSLFVWAVKIR